MYHFSAVAMAAAAALGNTGTVEQHAFVVNSRTANWHREQGLAEMMPNAARVPADVWRDFDTVTRGVMLGDEGSSIFNDLERLARNVNIGQIVSEYRKAGDDEMEVRSSIDGNHAKPVNRGGYEYDGALVMVHSTQVGRQWREQAGMVAAGFDGLRDDQENAVRFVRRKMVDNFIGGQADATYKGYRSYGIKNSPNSLALNLGAGGLATDLTAAATTYDQFRAVFVAALQALHGNGNNAVGDITFYVSSEIWFNGLKVANSQVSTTESVIEALRKLPGVADIKKSDRFTGNEFAAVILSSEYIRPIIGMPITNTPIPRVTPMDDWNVLVWSASGLQIKSDASGRSGTLYASAA